MARGSRPPSSGVRTSNPRRPPSMPRSGGNSMRKLKMGMVGGGSGALIGAVHRRAAIMDGEVEFVAGALSSSREKGLTSSRELGLTEERNYASWEQMLED